MFFHGGKVTDCDRVHDCAIKWRTVSEPDLHFTTWHPEQWGEKGVSNAMHLLTYSRRPYWKTWQLALFHTVKLSGPVVNRRSMAKGKLREREHMQDSILILQHWACRTSMILIKLKLSSPSSEQLLLTSGPHLMTHPKLDLWWWLTRPCPGHKLLFRQAYLAWGVKGEQWITLSGLTQSKRWPLSDDRTSNGVSSPSRSWFKLCIKRGLLSTWYWGVFPDHRLIPVSLIKLKFISASSIMYCR